MCWLELFYHKQGRVAIKALRLDLVSASSITIVEVNITLLLTNNTPDAE